VPIGEPPRAGHGMSRARRSPEAKGDRDDRGHQSFASRAYVAPSCEGKLHNSMTLGWLLLEWLRSAWLER